MRSPLTPSISSSSERLFFVEIESKVTPTSERGPLRLMRCDSSPGSNDARGHKIDLIRQPMDVLNRHWLVFETSPLAIPRDPEDATVVRVPPQSRQRLLGVSSLAPGPVDDPISCVAQFARPTEIPAYGFMKVSGVPVLLRICCLIEKDAAHLDEPLSALSGHEHPGFNIASEVFG